MTKFSKNHAEKVYCEKCDLVFESRQQFENHLDGHMSKFVCETCPVDTVISKLVNIFRRKSSRNLE
ncbi:hypothetical protein K0U27_08865 [archaeon]|nr:hypothetical protein [archaeon]